MAPCQRGFTLLELMVVIVIIGVVITFGLLSVGGNQDPNREEARRLSALLEMLSDEAILTSQVLGIRFDQDGYGFYRFEGSKWHDLSEDPLFRERRLPESTKVQLYLDGMAVGLDTVEEPREEAQDTVARKPQVLVMPTGERTPFELALVTSYEERREDQAVAEYRVEAPLLGAPQWRAVP